MRERLVRHKKRIASIIKTPMSPKEPPTQSSCPPHLFMIHCSGLASLQSVSAGSREFGCVSATGIIGSCKRSQCRCTTEGVAWRGGCLLRVPLSHRFRSAAFQSWGMCRSVTHAEAQRRSSSLALSSPLDPCKEIQIGSQTRCGFRSFGMRAPFLFHGLFLFLTKQLRGGRFGPKPWHRESGA